VKGDVEEWRREKEREFEDARRHYATEVGRYELQATEHVVAINERQALMI
jgi:hypothetical protein